MARAHAMKNTPGMNIQDAFVTYKPMGDMLKVDAGYMLTPMAHNAVQGAGTLFIWDYFSHTFRQQRHPSTPPRARWAAISASSLRGLVAAATSNIASACFRDGAPGKDQTEVASRNSFRVAGRVQINLLDAETGFFYGGTYLGAKSILSLGGAFDINDIDE